MLKNIFVNFKFYDYINFISIECILTYKIYVSIQ